MKEFRLETDFQDWLLKKLRKIPRTKWVKINDKVTAGIPDIYGCVNSFSVVIELKISGNSLSPLQEFTLEEYKNAGGIAYCLYPCQANEFLKEMCALAKTNV